MTTATRRAEGAEDVPATLAAVCYRGSWRAVVALLMAASRAGLLLIVARILLGEETPDTPRLVGWIAAMIVAPEALAVLLRHSFTATVGVENDAVVITRPDVRIEIPRSAIVAVMPWTLPLPTPGASLMLRSGTRFGYGLGLTAPSRLVAFLAEHTGAGGRTVRADPAFLHADAAAAVAGAFGWRQWLVKFPLLGLLPTAVLFRADQWITYGGTFGQYYTYGARAYALTFLGYWVTVTIYLALWAGVWRMAAEVTAWVVARLAPAAAFGVRRGVEMGCRVLYYGGVPALLALRFLA